MNELYIVNINDIADSFNDAINLVTNQRRSRALKFHHKEDQLRSVIAGLLLRKVLNVTDDEQLDINKYGKIRLKQKSKEFNLSHSGNYVCLAVSDKMVGVDIEKLDLPMWDVAEHAFHCDELDYLYQIHNKYVEQTLRDKLVKESFYSIWTLKESYIKALGLGLSHGTKEFRIIPEQKNPYRLNGTEWYFAQYWPDHEHLVSVCSTLSHFPTSCTPLGLELLI